MRVNDRNPVNRVREFLLARDLEGLPDSELLTRFAASRDEDSFTTLVRRHTPLVIGTARRIVGTATDADDVFQATFLTLARKANSIRCDGTLAPWLHRVTWRLAVRARKRSRPVAGEPRPVETTGDPLSQITGRELCSVIDEELARLSTGLQATVVLCCLQGLSRDEAAAKLGWSVATVKRRLARARAILERRLSARGVTLSAALAPALLAANMPASAASYVVGPTVEAAMGRAGLPGQVSALCGASAGVPKGWYIAVAAGGLLVAGLVWGLRPESRETPPAPPSEAEAAKADDRPTAGVDFFGDPLPPGAVARIGTTRFRHDEWVNHAVWSPDGKYIATAAGRVVIVWDAATGRELARQSINDEYFPPRKKTKDGPYSRSGIVALDWSPDGSALGTEFNNAIQHWAWDPATKRLGFPGRAIHSSAEYGSVLWSDWSVINAQGTELTIFELSKQDFTTTFTLPEGKFERATVRLTGNSLAVVTADAGKLFVFDRSAPKNPPRALGARVTKIAFSGDGKTFAAAAEDADKIVSIEIWDATTWKSRLRIPYPKSTDRPAEMRAFALSPDGKTLVTGAADKTLRWWDTITGKETRKFGPGRVYYNKAAFRPDGKVLLTVSHENHIRLWDVETGKEVPIPSGPAWTVAATAITPDGKTVLSISDHTLYAHDAATGRELWHRAEHTDTAVQVLVTLDGSSAITSGNDGTIIFWDVKTGNVQRKIENSRHSTDFIAISPDGRILTALGGQDPHDGKVLTWDVRTGKPLGSSDLPAKDARYAASSIRWAPDGSGVAVASGTELRVPVFDPARKVLTASYGRTDGGVTCAEYSPDGRMIAAGTLGDSLMIWETATGQGRLTLKDFGTPTCLAFSPDGRILAVATRGRHTEKLVGRVLESQDDPTQILLLDSFTGRELHRFSGHTGGVYRLAWMPDGRRLLSASQDASCLIWDVTSVRNKLPKVAITEKAASDAVEVLSTLNALEAYQAMARLTGSPETAVGALRAQLRPVPTADPARVAELVRHLDSPQFATRDRAAAELIRMGEGSADYLKTALDGKLSPEARDRIEKVLAELKPSSLRLRQGRSLEVLQRIGNEDARKLLTELAGGADGAWLTRESRAALGRAAP